MNGFEIIEQERNKRLKTFRILFFIGLGLLLIGAVLLIIYFVNQLDTDTIFTIGLVFGIPGFVLIILSFSIPGGNYNRFVKDNLEKVVMNDVYKSNKYSYIEHNGISYKEMNYSGVFTHPDEFTTSDTVRSSYKDVEFVLSDYIFTRITVSSDSKGNRTEHRYPYPGRFMSFNLERDFGFGLSIIDKRNNVDVFHTKLYKIPVEFESIDFNKRYYITTSSKEKTFYIIRPKEIIDLIDFSDKYKGHLVNVVVNNKVYFFLSDVSIEFHYSIFKKLDEGIVNDIKAYYEIPLRIIDKFNLAKQKFNDANIDQNDL